LSHHRRRFLRFESKNQPLLPPRQFAERVALNFGFASLLIGVSLLIGMAGYALFEGMTWIDAFANAAMLIFATGIILAPVVHRLLHQFHVDTHEKD
jgi:hypothetical protein